MALEAYTRLVLEHHKTFYRTHLSRRRISQSASHVNRSEQQRDSGTCPTAVQLGVDGF